MSHSLNTSVDEHTRVNSPQHTTARIPQRAVLPAMRMNEPMQQKRLEYQGIDNFKGAQCLFYVYTCQVVPKHGLIQYKTIEYEQNK